MKVWTLLLNILVTCTTNCRRTVTLSMGWDSRNSSNATSPTSTRKLLPFGSNLVSMLIVCSCDFRIVAKTSDHLISAHESVKKYWKGPSCLTFAINSLRATLQYWLVPRIRWKTVCMSSWLTLTVSLSKRYVFPLRKKYRIVVPVVLFLLAAEQQTNSYCLQRNEGFCS